jgi:hypothetical protein
MNLDLEKVDSKSFNVNPVKNYASRNKDSAGVQQSMTLEENSQTGMLLPAIINLTNKTGNKSISQL